MEQTSFDPSESMRAAKAGNREEHGPLNQDQPNPEPADFNSIKDLPKEVGVMLITTPRQVVRAAHARRASNAF